MQQRYTSLSFQLANRAGGRWLRQSELRCRSREAPMAGHGKKDLQQSKTESHNRMLWNNEKSDNCCMDDCHIISSTMGMVRLALRQPYTIAILSLVLLFLGVL